MNLAHLHLLMNHFPVMGTVFGTLAILFGYWRRKEDFKRFGMIVLVLAAVVTIPVWLTGDPAEKAAEGLPGVVEGMSETHENAALLAFICLGVTAVIAVIGMARAGCEGKISKPLTMIVFVLAICSVGLMARTANLGGQIRHTEIRAGYVAASDAQAAKTEADKD